MESARITTSALASASGERRARIAPRSHDQSDFPRWSVRDGASDSMAFFPTTTTDLPLEAQYVSVRHWHICYTRI